MSLYQQQLRRLHLLGVAMEARAVALAATMANREDAQRLREFADDRDAELARFNALIATPADRLSRLAEEEMESAA